jgi:predicted RNA-binding Zn ribbon-like protein
MGEKELEKRFVKFEGFDLDGGHPVLDFTNTVDWRGTAHEHDWLEDFPDLLAWCHRTGFLPDSFLTAMYCHAELHPGQAAFELKLARTLREAIFELLRASIETRPPRPECLKLFNRHLRRAMSQLTLNPGTSPGEAFSLEMAPGTNPLEQVLFRILRQAAELLSSSDLARLKICGNPECGWLFLDTTRNGSRRWCDMAACGNRAKAQRFYRKKKADTPPAQEAPSISNEVMVNDPPTGTKAEKKAGSRRPLVSVQVAPTGSRSRWNSTGLQPRPR